MRHIGWHVRQAWLVALMIATFAAPSTGGAASSDSSFRYLAIIGGDCERLVLAGHDQTPVCSRKMINVDFGDGRVGFSFTSPAAHGAVVTTFIGRSSVQKDLRSYRLEIDQVSTTTSTADDQPRNVVEAAAGHCAMTGDPTREAARFECTAERPGGRTTATFVSAGAPTVYAGERDDADGDPPSVARNTPTAF